MTTPTIREMQRVYVESAAVERLKCGKPSVGTVRNTLVSVKRFVNWAEGVGRGTWERRVQSAECEVQRAECEVPASAVTPKTMRKYLAFLLSTGMKPISASSCLNHLQQLFARWVRPYYEDHGWRIPQFPTVSRRARSPRYNRPTPEQLAGVKEWYEGLAPDMFWFVATMMLEFGMRNGDIRRLTRANFITVEGKCEVQSAECCTPHSALCTPHSALTTPHSALCTPHSALTTKHFLNYTPNKTAHSSGRVVRWPIHSQIWESFAILKPWAHKVTDTHFEKLNQAMRSLGFTGTKGAYELRKICIDHVYQKCGAEMATSISGDDIKTIIRYYADPAQPNMGEMRITDLL